MRVGELFEDEDRLPDEAPFVLTIINNLLKKGTEVRVYFDGDGGQIESLQWISRIESVVLRYGFTVFKLSFGLGSLTVNDVSIDKMKLFQHKRSSFSSKDMFTLRMPNSGDRA